MSRDERACCKSTWRPFSCDSPGGPHSCDMSCACGVCDTEEEEKLYHRLEADTSHLLLFDEDGMLETFGREFLCEIFPEAITEFETTLKELKQDIKDQDQIKIAFSAHKLVGPAANLMLHKFAAIAKHAELAARHLSNPVIKLASCSTSHGLISNNL